MTGQVMATAGSYAAHLYLLIGLVVSVPAGPAAFPAQPDWPARSIATTGLMLSYLYGSITASQALNTAAAALMAL